MTSQHGKQTVVIHILPNISMAKSNQTMKFGQTIKSYTQECGEETILRYFSQKPKLSTSLKFYAVCFYCMSSWGLSKYIENKLQTTCFYLIESV